MFKKNVTEDRKEIFEILKSFVTGNYNARKLIYTHVSFENIEGTIYKVTSYQDELSFTSSNRLWLERRLENFTSDFEKESIENVHKKVTQGCIKADKYMKEICEFPINGELEILGNYIPGENQ